MSLADIAINNNQGEEENNPEDIEKLELAGERFKGLVLERKYKEAREYWDRLDSDKKRYINNNEKYSRWLRPLRMSRL